MRTLRTEIEIDAPREEVWTVLADTATYPEWNPFVRELSGELTPGARLRARIGRSRPVTMRPRVLVADPGRELRWRGRLGVPGLFDGEHAFTLEDLPGERTRFVQSESFSGLLVPLVWRAIGTDTELGFRELDAALAARVGRRPQPA